MNSTFLIGLDAEHCIIRLYKNKLYKILKHRFKTKFGEIDIIAKKDNLLVFIEVKKRDALYEDIITARQQKRITYTTELFLSQSNDFQNYDIRFDLAIVRSNNKPLIIKNAW